MGGARVKEGGRRGVGEVGESRNERERREDEEKEERDSAAPNVIMQWTGSANGGAGRDVIVFFVLFFFSR